jgi:hypothetical protein
MAANLTLAQTISIATQSAIPPWHASKLRAAGQTGNLSMRAIRDQVQSRHTIFLVQVRDASILKSSSSFSNLQANWKSLNSSFVPSRTSMANLLKSLSTAGVSVVALSKDWRTMWLAGPTSAFCAVQGVLLGDAIGSAPQTAQGKFVEHVLSPNWTEVVTGLAVIGATCLAVGSLPVTAPVTAVLAIGVVLTEGVGIGLVADGAMGLAEAQPGTVTTSPNPAQSFDTTGTTPDGGVQDATVYGADSTVAAQQVATTASAATPVTDTSLPAQPVSPPICPVTPVCPVITPVCPVTNTPICPGGIDPGGGGTPTCPGGTPIDPGGGVTPITPICPGGI